MERQSHGAFEEALAALAGDLNRLRIERGKPSYRDLVARADASGTGIRLSVATQSDVFNGRRLVRADTFMGLVRMLYAYDEYGRETAVPSHTAPELVVWRQRWQQLAALQPAVTVRSVPARDREARAEPGTATPRPVPVEAPRTYESREHARSNAATATPAPNRSSAFPDSARIPLPAGSDLSDPGPYVLRHHLTGDAAPALDVVFSPDGRHLASAGGDVVRLWDTTTGLAILPPLSATHPLAFASDGMLIARDARDPLTLRWFAPSTGLPSRPAVFHSTPVTAIACARTGSAAATIELDGTVRLSGPDVGRRSIVLVHGGDSDSDHIDTAAFVPDGRLLAATRGGRVWDLIGKETLPRAALAAGSGTPELTAFSPDGRLLALGYEDGRVTLWDMTAGRDGPPMAGHAETIFALAFSPDGRLLATGSHDRTVRLWDTVAGRAVGPALRGHTHGVEAVAFSPDGQLLAAASEGGVLIYERVGARPAAPLAARALAGALRERTAVRLPPVQAERAFVRMAFSPDGRVIAATTAGASLRVWDPVTRKPLAPLTAAATVYPPCLAFSPDGALLAGACPGRTVWLRDPVSGMVRREWPTGEFLAKQLAFSSDGRRVWSLGVDGLVQLRDASDGRPIDAPLGDEAGAVTGIALSADGRRLATADTEGRVLVWHPGTPRPVGGPFPGREMAFSPDGRILATAHAGTSVRLWDLNTGRQHAGPLTAHESVVNDLAFSPDGTLLATAGQDGVTLLWDPATGQRVGSALTGHDGTVNGLAFSPDGSLLATAGADGVLHLWVMGPL
ncbi:WD40 repeat domain-containing protein [Streptomyces sp. NPDC046876]|uniref:WD40 repeat domain-containing protein n=1 Tax=Streptomyces sp. NPDC046876 TaxID=3155616 RepID=UPI003410DA0B